MGFYRIARPRRRLRQVVNDIELGGLHVGADGKRQVNETLPATNEGIDVGQPRRVAQHVFLRLDDVRFHLFRGCCAPEVGDRYLRLLDIG